MDAFCYVPFAAANARHTHPAMKHTPPIGVIAPTTRTPVNAMAYSEPEKSTVPATKSQPLAVDNDPGHRDATHATANSAMA